MRQGWTCQEFRRPALESLEARVLLDGNPQILINEIMYHPGFGQYGQTGYVAEDVRQEYIELYNRGPSAVDVGGWQFTRGVDFTIPATSIAAGGYLVVAADVAAFHAKYPGVTAPVVGGWTGKLGDARQTVELTDQAGNVADVVSYADDGDWALRRQGPADPLHPTWYRGWEYASGADAGGKSLELVNQALSNDFGQNWASSIPDQGTPGAPNSVAAGNSAPLILDVAHLPAVPKSSESVTITARIVDELPAGTTVKLYHRLDGQANFVSDTMYDDGLHGDGPAGDGVYGAILPAQPNRTVVEFYVRAADAAGKARTWPWPTDELGTQGANLLYQVDDATYTGNQPAYHLVTTSADYAAWTAMMTQNAYLDMQMNGTFITTDGTGTQVRYNVGIRNRGAGTRLRSPRNYRVNIPGDQPWNDLTAIDLNTQYIHAQMAGNAIFQLAGMPAPDGVPVAVLTNGVNLANVGGPQFGSYLAFEPYNTEYADANFPDDQAGNIYKGTRDGNGDAGFEYLGNPDDYRSHYYKQTNAAEENWADLVHLTDVLNNAPDATYTQDVEAVVNVDEWLKFFALNALLGNRENSLGGGLSSATGDDYSMYIGTVDRRAMLLIHDMDTVLGEGDTAGNTQASIFLPTNLPVISRFLKWKDFAPRYYAILQDLMDTVFSPAQIDPMLDNLLGSWVPASTIENMKRYVIDRNAYVRSQIPQAISITSPLTTTGDYPTTTTASTSLTGKANAITTRAVLVNGQPAAWSAWDGSWSAPAISLRPGVNRVLVQSMGADGKELQRQNIDIRRSTGTETKVSGILPVGITTWTLASSPYHVTANMTVPAGATLNIEAGATVFFDAGMSLTVNGRLNVQGTELQRVHLARTPGAATGWGGIHFSNTQQDNQIVYANIEYADSGGQAIGVATGRLLLDHVTFGHSTVQYLTLDWASVIVRDSVFPSLVDAELVHFYGFPAGGYAIFDHNWFGGTTGYNDIIDFTGGKRPGPIAQFTNNTFTGGSDDVLDLDGTDALVEGNVFMHIHQDAPRESLSHAVSTGEDSGNSSNITVVRNLFYDVDYALLIKDGSYGTFVNNTVVHVLKAGINLYEVRSGQYPGVGVYVDGNIFYDVPTLFANPVTPGYTTEIVVNHSIIPGSTVYPGVGNSNLDPHLLNTANVTDPRLDFRLQSGSPASGTGPNGADMGGIVPAGASISGVPVGATTQTGLTLNVSGPDIYAYKWRLNNVPWSAEIARPLPTFPGNAFPAVPPIVLAGLANGTYAVQVIVKNSAGLWQDPSQAVTSSSWTVNTALAGHVRINEVLAANVATLSSGGQYPDLVELYNDGGAPVALAGLSLTDDPAMPRKFVFPAGTPALGPGQYLVVYADSYTATAGIHLGFSLKANGEGVYLYNASSTQLDGVTFGLQLADLSIGRFADGWRLARPTFGAANAAMPTGNAATLKINEWLTDAAVMYACDFIELYNPDTLPVAIGGMYLTDNPSGQPGRQQIAPLSFIAGSGMRVFLADSKPASGPEHVDFKLSPNVGMIGLFGADLTPVDSVFYASQQTDISQGRSPNGTGWFNFFVNPNPGFSNPGPTVVTETLHPIVVTSDWRYNQGGVDLGTAWRGGSFPAESTWSHGPGALYVEESAIPVAKSTPLTLGRMTYYFRSHFTLPGDLSQAVVTMNTILDDGAVIYLNGREFTRIRIDPTVTVDYNTPATAVGNAVWDGAINVPTSFLAPGDNVIAVEVHQNSSGSSDIVFGLTLDMTVTTTMDATDMTPLRATEIMYNPPAPPTGSPYSADDFEYVELKNTGPSTLHLQGAHFTEGIDYTFGNIDMAAGQTILVVKNRLAFQSRYGSSVATIAGEFTGTLDNAGEPLSLADGLGQNIFQIVYSDANSWPGRAGGQGSSLELIDPARPVGVVYDAGNWRSSAEYAGTPGWAGAGMLRDVQINKVLTHTDAPRSDSIELYNTTGAAIAIGGWYLSDSSANYLKFRIPAGTILPARGYLVFDESDLNPTPLNPGANDFSLNGAHGDEVFLTAGDGSGNIRRFVDHVTFGPAFNSESFGRYPNGSGELLPMQRLTLGYDNSYPRVGPVIVSEIMYHPTDLSGGVDDTDNEYIELYNPGSSAVTLSSWYENHGNPQSFPWKLANAADYAFPVGTSIAAHGTVVVVGFDPSADPTKLGNFRAKYGIGTGVTILGPWQGKLSNSGETIELLRPDEPPLGEPAYVPYILADQVDYGVASPWTSGADQTGLSLQRGQWMLLGDEPANWSAISPTPGSASFPSGTPATVTVASVNAGRPGRSIVTSLSVTFSKDVSGSLAVGDLVIHNLTTGVDLSPSVLAISYSAATRTAIWTFPGLAGGTLAEGGYIATLGTAGVTDLAGNPLDGNGNGVGGDDYTITFHRLPGDASGDGMVDVGDLGILGANYGRAGADLPGDLNGDGVVDVGDLGILGASYGKSIDGPLAGGLAWQDAGAAMTQSMPTAQPATIAQPVETKASADQFAPIVTAIAIAQPPAMSFDVSTASAAVGEPESTVELGLESILDSLDPLPGWALQTLIVA